MRLDRRRMGGSKNKKKKNGGGGAAADGGSGGSGGSISRPRTICAQAASAVSGRKGGPEVDFAAEVDVSKWRGPEAERPTASLEEAMANELAKKLDASKLTTVSDKVPVPTVDVPNCEIQMVRCPTLRRRRRCYHRRPVTSCRRVPLAPLRPASCATCRARASPRALRALPRRRRASGSSS